MRNVLIAFSRLIATVVALLSASRRAVGSVEASYTSRWVLVDGLHIVTCIVRCRRNVSSTCRRVSLKRGSNRYWRPKILIAAAPRIRKLLRSSKLRFLTAVACRAMQKSRVGRR
jgi:hypothetical protein